MNVNQATEELRKINNQITLLMGKKRALKKFLNEEELRLKQETGVKHRAWELKHDLEFIKEHGRERTIEEVARIMTYSERQIQRFLNEKN